VIPHAPGPRDVNAIRKLSLAVDQSPASVLITDTRGRIEYVNSRFTEATGYAADEAVGNTPRMLKSGLTPAHVYADLWRTIASGSVWRGALQNRRKDGTLYWDAVNIAPLRDDDGTVTHFVATQQDITERRAAEEAAGEREQRFRQLAENIKEAFFVVDHQLGETLYVSPAYETIWGRTCRSLHDAPRSFLDAVPADDRERLLAELARVRAGERSSELDFRVVRPNGDVRWVLWTAAPVRDDRGHVYRITAVALDITERRHAQIALADGESRFRKLIETSYDGIAIVAQGRIVDANPGMVAMFGYPLDELIGMPAVDLAAGGAVGVVADRIANAIEGRYEFVGRCKDGREIVVEATARSHPIDGRPGRITALRDITSQRQTEEQVRQGQKMEAIGRLAGGMSHDFNNLLTVITSYASLLKETLSPSDPRRTDVGEISKAAADAASLTRQLLAFSRQQVIEPRLVALNDVVANSEKMLRRLIGEDVVLVAALPAEPLAVRIDPGQFEQVIMNLAVNARDAMPNGGRLTFELTATTLDDPYARAHWPATPGRFALLAVSDTGIGMDAETRARVFEPFFTTKAPGKGTGLGLSTAYGIVKQSQGFIWVYSEPGQGTTFKIYLPLVDESAESFQTPSESLEAARGDELVLLVEDFAPVRAATRLALEQFGYAVVDVASGADALALAADPARRIQILMTDVVMPEMNGRQLAEQFTRLRPQAKVLFVSGYATDAVVRHGVLAAGAAFLQKPFSPDTLARKVRKVLDA